MAPLPTPPTAVASTSSIIVICTAEEECMSTGSHKVSGHLCGCTSLKHADHLSRVRSTGGASGNTTGPAGSLSPPPMAPDDTHLSF